MLSNPIEVGDIVEVFLGQFAGAVVSMAIVTAIEKLDDGTTKVKFDMEGHESGAVYHSQNSGDSPRRASAEQVETAAREAQEGHLQRIAKLEEDIRKSKESFELRRTWFEHALQQLKASE